MAQSGSLMVHFVAILIAGHMHNIISPTQYENLCACLQTLYGSFVIPIFFYSAHGELYAKCIRPHRTGVVSKDNVKLLIPKYFPYRSTCFLADLNVTSPHVIEIGDGVSKKIPFPNPWRLRAGGRVILHVPITLYADDNGKSRFCTSSPSLAFHPWKPISNTTIVDELKELLIVGSISRFWL
ncbi:hypothetical protein VP01_17g14 [Puccinia sorghi]|uniref:Uncharacterized protein n=1 Tax=Puccinia sorghi TaxID=27349 RepID=A0A0L6VEX4_9BASI|nr:hypothetical protein VP01_17g14 [Puccinia sorghi]